MATAPAPAHAVCVFAVRRGRGPDLPPDLTGHEGGGPLRLVPAGALWAVVQDVPADDYSEDALRERLSEPATLERCVRDHHAVVTAFAARSGAIPLPLATLYHSEERCRAALTADVPRFERTLERITGRNEWAVKVNLLAVRKPEPQTAQPPQESPAHDEAPAPSGRAYLARLRERGQERDDRRQRAVNAAELLDRAVLSIADATVRRRLHGAEIVGRDRTQILNAAYLVPEQSGAEFNALLDQLRAAPEFEGCEVEVTGPWVPYSFVDTASLAETDAAGPPQGSHAGPPQGSHARPHAGSRT
ncbi:GvpL/GvpF family gas vesicle protein [Streptomyces sp. NPDC050439]|uniref:GvpL/GvpF family gas vesicle protein n=1 Tax=unclassified Streptomyces TaxID=2593676 RepID=UPI00341FD739